MILAAYRNPPYRSPTPRANGNNTPSISPPPPERSQSPKRKRPEEVAESPLLNIATTVSYEEVMAESGANSPRTKVAERFKDLSFDASEPPKSSQSPRKKLKRMPGIRDPRRGVDGVGEVHTPKSAAPTLEMEIPDSEGPSLMEISRTPEPMVEFEDDMPSSSSSPVPQPMRRASPHVMIPSLRKEASFLETRAEPTSSPPTRTTGASKRRLSSPPPPLSQSSDLNAMALDPLPDEALVFDQSTLTWHVDEITGHDIDTGNPDDDGEGINGIGFRPTPAMAYARSLKRKKQVEDWKSREAREARQRRMERRRGAGGSGGSAGEMSGGKRVVRFAES